MKEAVWFKWIFQETKIALININITIIIINFALLFHPHNYCSLILDNERWKQADVPLALQSLVDSLVDGKNCHLL